MSIWDEKPKINEDFLNNFIENYKILCAQAMCGHTLFDFAGHKRQVVFKKLIYYHVGQKHWEIVLRRILFDINKDKLIEICHDIKTAIEIYNNVGDIDWDELEGK